MDALIPAFYNSINILIIAATWSILWSGIALWASARNEQPAWFIAILIINVFGIPAIVYLLFYQREKHPVINKRYLRRLQVNTHTGIFR